MGITPMSIRQTSLFDLKRRHPDCSFQASRASPSARLVYLPDLMIPVIIPDRLFKIEHLGKFLRTGLAPLMQLHRFATWEETEPVSTT